MTRKSTRRPLWRRLKEQGWGVDEIVGSLGAVTPPIDVIALAQDMEISVEAVPDPGWAGAVQAGSFGATIWVNADHPLVRQRFTVAHELGHLFLHDAREAFRDGAPDNSPKEIEANRFAAELLMPRRLVGPLASKLSVSELARSFAVSEIAMRKRLDELFGRRR